MRRGFADTSLGQIHYREHGRGEPLLLLHQTTTASVTYTDAMPYLGESFRAIAMDTLGYGDSDQPDEPPGMEGYTRSIAELLDSLGIDRTHILGHHTGSGIAAEFAATYPERVVKVVIVDRGEYPAELRQQRLAELTADAAAGVRRPRPASATVYLPIEADGTHLLKGWLWATSRIEQRGAVTLEHIHQAAMDNIRPGGKWGFAYLALHAQDIRATLARITAPTMLLYGEHGVHVAQHGEMLALLQNGTCTIVPGGGRYPMWEDPEEFSRIVTDFLLA